MPEFLETTVDKFIFKVAADRLYSPEGVWVPGSGERPSSSGFDRLPAAMAATWLSFTSSPSGTSLAAGGRVRRGRDDQGDVRSFHRQWRARSRGERRTRSRPGNS